MSDKSKPLPDFTHHRVFTIVEACQFLRLSRMSVHRLMKDGKLPVSRLSPRCIRIKREHLESLMAGAK